jgi:hypothetical protein
VILTLSLVLFVLSYVTSFDGSMTSSSSDDVAAAAAADDDDATAAAADDDDAAAADAAGAADICAEGSKEQVTSAPKAAGGADAAAADAAGADAIKCFIRWAIRSSSFALLSSYSNWWTDNCLTKSMIAFLCASILARHLLMDLKRVSCEQMKTDKSQSSTARSRWTVLL